MSGERKRLLIELKKINEREKEIIQELKSNNNKDILKWKESISLKKKEQVNNQILLNEIEIENQIYNSKIQASDNIKNNLVDRFNKILSQKEESNLKDPLSINKNKLINQLYLNK